jgi:hypothetical protein
VISTGMLISTETFSSKGGMLFGMKRIKKESDRLDSPSQLGYGVNRGVGIVRFLLSLDVQSN